MIILVHFATSLAERRRRFFSISLRLRYWVLFSKVGHVDGETYEAGRLAELSMFSVVSTQLPRVLSISLSSSKSRLLADLELPIAFAQDTQAETDLSASKLPPRFLQILKTHPPELPLYTSVSKD